MKTPTAPIRRYFTAIATAVVAAIPTLGLHADGEQVLVEAESFAEHGGWKLDTQFIGIMGSPYLLAHGLGQPVADATTEVRFPKAGEYRLWVRTKDWVAKWDAEGAPGRFQVIIDGQPVDTEFGATGADWHWQDGGTVTVGESATLALHDLTGFNGRCDALLFSSDPEFRPDNSSEILPAWRREMLGLSAEPVDEGPYDIVFIGGGYAGTCGAISAARMGVDVALIQNRGVLGGNGSSEVRVWAMGNTPPGLYPVGDIVREIEDDASASPAPAEEFEDDKKEAAVRAEEKLDLFLHHHAFDVEMSDDGKTIESVLAFDTRSGAVKRFKGRFFCDSTGHGTIGLMAGADYEMIDEGRMGMSNMWTWEDAGSPQDFPTTPWALDLEEGEFPYPQRFHAQWFWESGYDKHPLNDLEKIRDWNLRAGFGAWNAIKNKGAYARSDESGQAHRNARLTWMAYIGGPRETLQLLGDVILTEEDVVNKTPYPDGCVLTTWSIDLHYPKEQYLGKFSENPFISVAVHGKGVDRKKGYPVPYRCFYSRNIDNLFMAGRNISVTHEALGTIRVMKTCGMMGVVVGKAAAIGTAHEVSPRDVYYQHLDELIELMRLPGNIRRDSLDGEFFADPDLPEPEKVELDYVPLDSLTGIIVDDRQATLTGKWTEGAGLKMYIGDGYHYAPSGDAEAKFEFKVPRDGEYEVRISHQPHENRSSRTAVTVVSAAGESSVTVNQRVAPPLANGFYNLGVHRFTAADGGAVIISAEGADGNVHADAVQVIEQK